MKTRLLFLLFSLFFSLSINAMPLAGTKNIYLKKQTVDNNKATRSIHQLAISAYFDSDNLSIGIDLGHSLSVTSISITNLSTNEIVSSELFTETKDVMLNLAGLLNEGEEYCLQITTGDTVYLGYFNY